MSWQDLAADRLHERLNADESWEALRQAWVAAYAAAADLVATRVDPALVASASGEQWITADEWSGIVEQAGVYDAVNDIVNDGLVASAVDLGVPLDDRTLMSTVAEFVRSIADAVDYLRATIDAFHESALRRQWTADEFGRALRTSGASPLSAARATRFATGQASGALNAGIRSGIDSCPRRNGIETFATTANSCSDIAAVRWVTQRDERVRPAHAAADTDTVPLGETFTIDGHPARFPGDPNLPIGLRINCRCYLAWVDGTGVRRILGATKADLYATAQRLDIDGRSRMSKAQLQSALLNELCLQGLAGGPDCPDLFDQMNRTTLMTYARQENVVGRWRMTKRELVEQLRATMRGGDRIRVAAGFAPAGEFSTAQRRATRKRARAAALELGDDQVPPYRLRRAARRDVYAEFGGDRRGYVPCAFCGLKVNPDPTSGLAVLVPTPIRPFADGGTAALANILPGCPSCFRAHAASRAAALVASDGSIPDVIHPAIASEGWDVDLDDIEMPAWVRERSEERLRRFLADAEFHLKGTEYDHDQSTHGGGGGRGVTREVAARIYAGDFRTEDGEEFRIAADIEPSDSRGDEFYVRGRISDDGGEEVGTFLRAVQSDGFVRNIHLAILPDRQNEGIGSAFLDRTEAALVEAGAEGFLVHAAGQVGRLAWASRGYRLDVPESGAVQTDVLDHWLDHWTSEGIRERWPDDDPRHAQFDALRAHWERTPRDVYPADLIALDSGFRAVIYTGPSWFGIREADDKRALVASAGKRSEQFDGTADDVEMPDWVRERSEERVRRFVGDAEFHLAGTQYDHDQSTHGGGGRTLAQMTPEERLAAVSDVYNGFRYEYQGETFRVAGEREDGAIDPERFPPVRARQAGNRILIGGVIVNEDGDPVGDFVREVFPDDDPPSVYNDTLSINDDHQQRGIGSAFLDQTEERLAGLGIERVQVTAVAVGKYAWAARGYRLDTDGLGDFGAPDSYASRRIESWAEEVNGIRQQLTDAEAAAADAVLAAWRSNPGDVIPADLLVVSPKMKEVFKRGLDWDGVRDLNDRQLAMAASAPSLFPDGGRHIGRRRQPIPDQEDTDEPDPPRRTPSESPGARSRRDPRRRVDPR